MPYDDSEYTADFPEDYYDHFEFQGSCMEKNNPEELEEMQSLQPCSSCWGRGRLPDGYYCPRCDGTGNVIPYDDNPF